MLSGIMKALYLFAWSHFLRRTGIHFAGKCSSQSVLSLMSGVNDAGAFDCRHCQPGKGGDHKQAAKR